MQQDPMIERVWRAILVDDDENSVLRRYRKLFRRLPSNPRCKYCSAPFAGVGGAVARTIFHRYPGNLNPGMCNACEEFAKDNPGGTEAELTLLFADVRGSTRLAEGMSPMAFSQLMDRFYSVSSAMAEQTDALIEKFVGDEVAALFVPGIAGQQHARRAIQGARSLLEATGHADPDGPWLPVGVGVHTGVAFVGAVGSGGIVQFTALGDAPNTAARLASTAAAGEILISEAAYSASGLDLGPLEQRELSLKGRDEPLQVRVLKVTPAS